ncbi:hypothetical protein [Parasedimentitalea psychrophila]|uniref:Uncharacterized protein n=1 Tax=Parasedimentitalea psychrophila TaxID=2997337 RepID=A0A9Y2L193_9RHOB|nr:hypothetical protein [Parasedimentitalea psychrophila]WIY26303.1 hypothetical protein QPJ95_05095 [Parasedimentitalea psychrophila]
MPPIRPAKIEAALLYLDYQPFAYAAFVDRLRLIFGDDIPVALVDHRGGAFGLINADGILIKISQNQQPLALAGFQGALASSYTKMQQPEAEDIVQGHRKTIFVTVGDDSLLRPDAAPETQSPGVVLFSNRVHIARLVVSQIVALNRPELIHWCPSDQLLKPEQLSSVEDPGGLALQIHPSLFSSGVDENGSQKIGFQAFGSEHVTGHHVFVEETAFALPGVIRAVNDFISSLTKTCELPKSGSVVQMKSGAALRVTQAVADYRFPRNFLLVEVLQPGRVTKGALKPVGRGLQSASYRAEKTAADRTITRAVPPADRDLTPLFRVAGLAAIVMLYLVASQFMELATAPGLTTLASN